MTNITSEKKEMRSFAPDYRVHIDQTLPMVQATSILYVHQNYADLSIKLTPLKASKYIFNEEGYE